MQRIIEAITYAIEKPAARRARLSAQHAQRKAREAYAAEQAHETRQDGRNPYPFHVYGQHTIGR